MTESIKTLGDHLVTYFKSVKDEGNNYPATIAKYASELFNIQENDEVGLALPALLIKTRSGKLADKEGRHQVDLICLDVNEAGQVAQKETVEKLVDWVIDQIPTNYFIDDNPRRYYFTGELDYNLPMIKEKDQAPTVVGTVTVILKEQL